MLGQERLLLQTFDSLQGNMILSITFLGTGLLGVLFAQDDLLAALGEVEDAEEELGTFLHTFSNHIVGLEFKVIIIGDCRYHYRLRARRDLRLAHL